MQSNGEKQALRAGLSIPEASFVVGCVAAVKKDHKRIDYLIREFSQLVAAEAEEKSISREAAKAAKLGDVIFAEGGAENSSLRSSRLRVKPSFPFLLIAGAKTGETAELIALAESLIPGRYKIVTDCARSQMPDLYRVMDVFVLTSLFEMMPIALLEALASGLPCVVNKHPVLEWMIGDEKRSGDSEQWAAGSGQWTDRSVSREAAKNAKRNNYSDMDEQDLQDNSGGKSQNAPSCISCSSMLNPSLDADVSTADCPLPTAHYPSTTGGTSIDMKREGALAQALAALTPDWLLLHGRQARERALKMFSKEAVIGQYVEYYREVLRDEDPHSTRD